MTRIRTALFQEVLDNQDAAFHGGRVRPFASLPALEEDSGCGRLLLDVGPSDRHLTCDGSAGMSSRAGSTVPSPTIHFKEDFILHLFTHRPSRREAPALFRPRTLSSFRRWYRLARPGLPVAALFSLSAARAWAADNGTIEFSQLNTLLTSLVAEHKIIVVTLFVLLGVAGLVMTIWQRTRVPGMLMAGICLVCAVLVSILVNSVNSMTGGDVSY